MTVITVQIYEISVLFYLKENNSKIGDNSDEKKKCDFIKRGNNSKIGDNMDKKKNTGHLFLHAESIYKISKHSTNSKHGSKLMICKIK